MNRTLLLSRNLINFGIPIGLFVSLIFLIKSSFLKGNDTLSLAITADLLLTIPLIYFLLIRKSKIPKTTVVPVMVIGLLIGSSFLPIENQVYLELFKNWALPVIELSVFIFVILKVQKAVNSYKELKNATPDFYDTLKNVCSKIFPKKLIIPFATEIAVFYYGFLNWKKRELSSNEFSYHVKSGSPSLFIGLIMILVIETITLHFVLEKWNIVFAWVLSGISLYTAIQFIGFARALAQRPITIEADKILLRYGIMNESHIAIADIESVILSKKELKKGKMIKTLSPFGELESYNVIIHLKKENNLTGFYGIQKKFKIIAFYVDQPNEFKEQLTNIMSQ